MCNRPEFELTLMPSSLGPNLRIWVWRLKLRCNLFMKQKYYPKYIRKWKNTQAEHRFLQQSVCDFQIEHEWKAGLTKCQTVVSVWWTCHNRRAAEKRMPTWLSRLNSTLISKLKADLLTNALHAFLPPRPASEYSSPSGRPSSCVVDENTPVMTPVNGAVASCPPGEQRVQERRVRSQRHRNYMSRTHLHTPPDLPEGYGERHLFTLLQMSELIYKDHSDVYPYFIREHFC